MEVFVYQSGLVFPTCCFVIVFAIFLKSQSTRMSTQNFNCDICNMTLNCYQQYMQHKTGRKHLNKAKQKGVNPDAPGSAAGAPSEPKPYGGSFVPASLSDVEGLLNGKQSQGAPQTVVPFNQGFNSNTLAQIAGQGNSVDSATAAEKQDPVAEAVRQNLLGNLPVKRKAEVVGTCEPCGLEFNSVDQQQAHLSGKKHAKKMKLSDKSNVASFFCSFCNLQLNSVEQMEQHRAGTKHKKKVGNAKNVQDEMRLASKLPKMTTEDLTAPPPPPPPVNIPPPPAELESMKYANY